MWRFEQRKRKDRREVVEKRAEREEREREGKRKWRKEERREGKKEETEGREARKIVTNALVRRWCLTYVALWKRKERKWGG